MMTQADPSAHEVIAFARDNRSWNGNVLGFVLERDHWRDVLLLEAEMQAALTALKSNDAETVKTAIRRLSGVLAS